jgi:hypothetical protein
MQRAGKQNYQTKKVILKGVCNRQLLEHISWWKNDAWVTGKDNEKWLGGGCASLLPQQVH